MRNHLSRFFNIYYSVQFILVVSCCFLLLVAKNSRAMDENFDDANATVNYSDEIAQRPALKKKGDLFHDLDPNGLKTDIARANQAFKNIDELFTRAIVKVQSIANDGTLGKEVITTLHEFLTYPHDSVEIVAALENHLKRRLIPKELAILNQESNLNFPKSVSLLWRNKLIGDKKAQAMTLQQSPLSSKELIRLVENGAVKAAKGSFVQLRTGKGYGDALTLFNKISEIIATFEEYSDLRNPLLLEDLFEPPVKPELADAFRVQGWNPEDSLFDANVIREMRQHFLFIGSLNLPYRFRAGLATFNTMSAEGRATVNAETNFHAIVSPETLSACLVGNHYFEDANVSLTNGIFMNPNGITYSGLVSLEGHGFDWWLNYSEGFLGAGMDYTVNFDQGTSWSNGEATYINLGAMAGGWKDYITAGISASTMVAQGVGLGINATMSVNRAHDVTLLGEYPKDGNIADLRGKYKVEVRDTKGISTSNTVGVNFSAAQVPLTVAFRVGTEHTKTSIYRTHVDLEKAQSMLTESDVAGILYIAGKKIRESKIPTFDAPKLLQVGDEIVQTKSGRLSGAFVLGLETLIPIHALRCGGTVDVKGEFELGLRRLPNDKFEVSIEPKRVYEMGFFASAINIFQAGHVKGMAVARKQIFMFDFKNPQAQLAYAELIHYGRLPISEDIEVYIEDRGPEYLLTDFRAQNETLAPRGIARTYLEKVRVSTEKTHIGLNSSLIPAFLDVVNKVDKESRKSKERLNLRFEGIDRESIRSNSESVATNGLISVKRITYGGMKSKGQGFSGRYKRILYVMHRRIHSLDENAYEISGNKWQFDSLVVHAQLEDTIITGDEENKMAEKINQLFGCFIGTFECRNSKAPRTINLERELNRHDLMRLTSDECRNRIAVASQTSGIDQQQLSALLKDLENSHHPDKQGLIIKDFIQASDGLTGFAAIHQLLGAHPEDLLVRTEGGYGSVVMDAKTFIAVHSNIDHQEGDPLINLNPITNRKNTKRVKAFYRGAKHHLRAIDEQLRLLYDDKYLIDENSPLYKYLGKEKVLELINSGMRQDKTSFKSSLVSTRKTILELLDLSAQGFSVTDRLVFYQMAGIDHLFIKERVEILLSKYGHSPLSVDMEPEYVRKRARRVWHLIAKIDRRINKLEDDTVMNIMDKDFVEASIIELRILAKKLSNLASLAHLDEKMKLELKAKLADDDHVRLKMFRAKRHRDFFIDGALAHAYAEDETSVTREK